MKSAIENPGVDKVRLQKYLADCGIGSRRACEKIIEAGRVSVNGETVTRQGVTVNPATDEIRVDGKVVRTEGKDYILLNKPIGIVCTSSDPQGRPTFLTLLPKSAVRLYTVGRLDRDSEGLLIVTNDGDLAQTLAHPSHLVEKFYYVWVSGVLTVEQMTQMKQGVVSDGETLRAVAVDQLEIEPAMSRYRVVLREGKKRQVRRMFMACGLRVWRLQRYGVGPLTLGSLRPGEWRRLSSKEVQELRRFATNPRSNSSGRKAEFSSQDEDVGDE
jgi:23S rRNA pseudouridine2605 synthase